MYELFYETMVKKEQFHERWNSDNTLFVIYIGFNDINHIIRKYNAKLDIDRIINALLLIIERIYEVGGRNILIMNVQPMEKIRYYRNKNPQLKEYARVNTIYFNERLNAISKMIYNQYTTDLNVFIFDTYGFYEEVIANCLNYKFQNCTISWRETKVKDAQKFFWYDEFHITNKANKYLAESINQLFESFDELLKSFYKNSITKQI